MENYLNILGVKTDSSNMLILFRRGFTKESLNKAYFTRIGEKECWVIPTGEKSCKLKFPTGAASLWQEEEISDINTAEKIPEGSFYEVVPYFNTEYFKQNAVDEEKLFYDYCDKYLYRFKNCSEGEIRFEEVGLSPAKEDVVITVENHLKAAKWLEHKLREKAKEKITSLSDEKCKKIFLEYALSFKRAKKISLDEFIVDNQKYTARKMPSLNQVYKYTNGKLYLINAVNTDNVLVSELFSEAGSGIAAMSHDEAMKLTPVAREQDFPLEAVSYEKCKVFHIQADETILFCNKEDTNFDFCYHGTCENELTLLNPENKETVLPEQVAEGYQLLEAKRLEPVVFENSVFYDFLHTIG